MPVNWRKRGMRIRRLREKRGWTQEMLADKVAVSRVTIARIEIGNRQPSLELLERIAKTLKVKMGDILE